MSNSEEARRNDPMIGTTLGQYILVSSLGHGGMASVYLARQESIGRTVAIKVLPAYYLHDPTFLQRFEREVKVIAHLQHPRILPVYDYGESGGQPYIVMAHMTGGTLSDRMRERALTDSEILRYSEQIAEGLDYAHSEGVIHRDFKPSNVLLDKGGNAHHADFGIAKINEGSSVLTGSGIVGTPAYMAPEMSTDGYVSPAADIYGLGVAIYEMFTGRAPFEGDTPMRVMMAHISTPPPDIRVMRTDLPEGVAYVIQRAMAKNPQERYPTAGQLAADLRTALSGSMPVSASAAPKNPTSQEATYVEQHAAPRRPTQQPVDRPAVRPKRRRTSPVLVLATVFTAAALIAVGYFIYLYSIGQQPTLPGYTVADNGTDGTLTAQRIAQTATYSAELAASTATAQFELDAAATRANLAASDATSTAAAQSAEATAQAALRSAADQTATAAVEQTATSAAQMTATIDADRIQQAVNAVNLDYNQDTITSLIQTVERTAPDYGPQAGSLPHEIDNLVESELSPASDYANFVLKATFTNPHSLIFGLWDTGVVFRSSDAFTQFRILVTADGTWAFEQWKGSQNNYTFIVGGVFDTFDANEGAQNTITIVVLGDRAYLVFNDQFIERLYVLTGNPSGNVGVGIGFTPGKERPEQSTPYEYTVWRLP